jgi:hypothetical protein
MSEALEPQDEVADLSPDTGAPTGAAPDVSGETDETVELEALAMGWKPESQYKGPKDKFVSAAEYVERGKTILPFLNKELSKAYKKIEGLEKAVNTAISYTSKAEQRAYAKAKADLEAELDAAAEAGNRADVRAITKDIIDLEAELAAAPKATPQVPPDFQAWMDDNPWYGQDKALSAACNAIGEEVFEEGFTGKAQIKEVDRRLREAFPAKFAKPENPHRRQAAAVEGSGSVRRPTGKTYADLPHDAKAMCEEMMKDLPTLTREKYAAGYFAEK